jgi:hypothetical protein
MPNILLLLACSASPVKSPQANGADGLIHISTAPAGEAPRSTAMSDKDRVFAVFRSSQEEMAECYLPALAVNPMLYGEMVVGLTLNGAGEVSEPEFVFATISDEAMRACVLAKVTDLAFPELQRESVKASYPYLFTSDRTPPEVVRALKVRHGLIPPDPTANPEQDPNAEPQQGQNGWYETW